MKLKETVARNVRQLRMERGLTQKALAKKARIGERYLSFIETDAKNISLDQLEKIAKALDVSVVALMLDDKGPRAKRSEFDGHFEKLSKDAERIEEALKSLKTQLAGCRVAVLEKI